jgi:dephospho-CoA kinase
MVSIGLTGGLGAGKSFAAKLFLGLGANILNADDIAKNLLRVNPELIQKIKDAFGEDCYEEGELQTAILAERAFKDNTTLKTLNAISHPVLRSYLEKYITAFKTLPGVLIIEVAILFEAGFQDLFDISLLITANDDQRLARALGKGILTESSIRERMALQMPENEKKPLSDFVIENNGSEEELLHACKSFLEKIHKQHQL